MFVPMETVYEDHFGSDLKVVNMARVSMDKHIDTFREQDARLIKYLAKHKHWTPFAHCSATFRFKAPIFVARQLVKHQVGLVWNEASRRYVDSDPEYYKPKSWRGRATNVKQGSAGNIQKTESIDYCFNELCEAANITYETLLNSGVAPEQARMVLPLNTMTEWYWTGTLPAWARVVNLRFDPHAQEECRESLQPLSDKMLELFPYSWSALMEYEQ